MKKNKINLSREQLEEVIQLFNRSMDDYLYLFDIQNDYYSISKHAVSRFCLPNYHFCDATKAHNYFVYEDDLPLLFDEFNKIKSGEITEHSLHYRWLDRQHNPVWVNCRGDVILDEFNKPLYLIGCVNEIGKRQKADNISGLLREPSLEEYVSSKSKNNITGYFMQIGIDDFDEINGRFGLKCGDEILKQFSMCMQSCINENQKIYELGNGRFIIMDLANHSKEDILELYDELKKSVEVALEENVYRVVYTISVGIVEIDKEMKDYDTLIKYSDFALNEAKKKGKNSCYFFTQDKYKQFIRRREIRVELQNAVDHNFKNFDVYYQPIIDIHTRNLIGAEALMRFKMKRNEQIEFISPAEFIPILEESGLIIPAGRWILRQAVACCKKWQEFIPEFKVNVNLSYVQIIKSRILDEIKKALKDYKNNESLESSQGQYEVPFVPIKIPLVGPICINLELGLTSDVMFSAEFNAGVDASLTFSQGIIYDVKKQEERKKYADITGDIEAHLMVSGELDAFAGIYGDASLDIPLLIKLGINAKAGPYLESQGCFSVKGIPKDIKVRDIIKLRLAFPVKQTGRSKCWFWMKNQIRSLRKNAHWLNTQNILI